MGAASFFLHFAVYVSMGGSRSRDTAKAYGTQRTKSDYHMSGDKYYGATCVTDHVGEPALAGVMESLGTSEG